MQVKEHMTEIDAYNAGPNTYRLNLALFVENCGTVLSQTRQGIAGCRLKDDDTAEIVYTNGYAKEVDISCCSWKAVMQELARKC